LLSKLHSRLRDQMVAQAGSRDAWVESLLGWFIRRLNDTVDAFRLTHVMAMTDQVSGLPNRRAAQARLEALLDEHRERGTAFAVLFVDGDRLKAYNEELGYEAGNEMISAVGGILAAAVREGDFVSRWLSGDEFLVLLPGARSNAAYAVGERLRDAVAHGSTAWALPVTVSVGVSACPEHGVTADDLVRAAAAASQRAKDRGRNRTELAAV
jgi:diguanylate cyclase (GGDEF)-like protein